LDSSLVFFLSISLLKSNISLLFSSAGIYRAEKDTAFNMVEMQNELSSSLLDIDVVSDQREKCAYSSCNISNDGCSDIC
jgi:hypothetical protein